MAYRDTKGRFIPKENTSAEKLNIVNPRDISCWGKPNHIVNPSDISCWGKPYHILNPSDISCWGKPYHILQSNNAKIYGCMPGNTKTEKRDLIYRK